MTTPRFATLALLATATTASANVVATDGYAVPKEPEKPIAQRFEGRLGMLLGGADVGDADGFSIGASAGIGYRIGDATVGAVFDHYRVGDSEGEALVRRGRGTRVGGGVRYSFANNAPDYDRRRGGLAYDFWGELGMGYEHVAWKEGGVLDRPSGEIAIGFDLDVYGERKRDSNRRRHLGYFMAFRTLVGRGPEMDGPAMCGGPCTSATKPSRIDLSMFFQMGLHWGR
jgi:hypothetical protein